MDWLSKSGCTEIAVKLSESIEISGGAKTFVEKLGRKPVRRMAVISVNASTDPEPKMDSSTKQPSLSDTTGAMSDAQLHRFNVAPMELMKKKRETLRVNPEIPPFLAGLGGGIVGGQIQVAGFRMLRDEARSGLSG